MDKQLKINLFPKAHLWLLIPFVLTLAGFYLSYWSKFSEAPWRQHMHGLSATAWYVLVILQPWLIHNKPPNYHKKWGLLEGWRSRGNVKGNVSGRSCCFFGTSSDASSGCK